LAESVPVSEENIALARRYYAALNEAYETGEIASLIQAVCDPEITVKPSGLLPETSEVHGRAETIMFITAQQQAFERLSVRPEEFIDAGEAVVVPIRLVGRARHTGIDVDLPFFQVASFRGERLLRMEIYTDKAEALRAAGLD
jgi:ketosteroid isomerase-like protein